MTTPSGPNAPKRLLIVDDERDLAEALAMHLQASGRYQVETVFCGEDAVERLRKDPPDKLLLDISLPGISGWEVCRWLKSQPAAQGVSVVLMTAWLQGEMAARAGDMGVKQVLIKPFEESELDRALELSAPAVDGNGHAQGQEAAP